LLAVNNRCAFGSGREIGSVIRVHPIGFDAACVWVFFLLLAVFGITFGLLFFRRQVIGFTSFAGFQLHAAGARQSLGLVKRKGAFDVIRQRGQCLGQHVAVFD